MNKKKTNYILVGLVLVWAVVFFWGGDKEDVPSNQVIKTHTHSNQFSIPKSIINNDEIKLSFDYRDPFLKNQTGKAFYQNKTTLPTPPKAQIKLPVNILKTIINPPQITYKGLINGKENKSDLGIIYINGKILFVKVNEVVDSLLIKTITDSVIIVNAKGKDYRYFK